jgi:hypothetical protein
MLKRMSDVNPKIPFTKWRLVDQKVYISNIKRAFRPLKLGTENVP